MRPSDSSSPSYQPADLTTVVAVNHPVRRRLLEQLSVNGPATASRLAATTDQMVGNVSHHLKVLASAGMIEEAPELAKNRRERWWRSVPASVYFSASQVKGDPDAELVMGAAEQQNLSHEVDKVRAWWSAREGFEQAWQDAAFNTSAWVRATPEELIELGERITAVIQEFAARVPEAENDARSHAFVFVHGVPAKP